MSLAREARQDRIVDPRRRNQAFILVLALPTLAEVMERALSHAVHGKIVSRDDQQEFMDSYSNGKPLRCLETMRFKWTHMTNWLLKTTRDVTDLRIRGMQKDHTIML